MADLTGPFDGPEGWSQTEWYTVAPTWAPSGIIGTPAASVGVGDFAVTASGLNVTVACNGDRAWIDGSGYKPDTDKTLAVTANGNVSLSRRDRIVIRRDLAAKTITVVRLAGTPAGTPAAPDLTQISGGIYDVPICSFLVPPNNGTTLTGFVDERGWVNPRSGGPLAFTSTGARDALPAFDGLSVKRLDLGGVEQHRISGAWKTVNTDPTPTIPAQPTRGVVTLTTDSAGLCYIDHGMGVTPTNVQCTLAHTSDGINSLAALTLGALSTTQIQLVMFRMDTYARLNDAQIKVHWLAWP